MNPPPLSTHPAMMDNASPEPTVSTIHMDVSAVVATRQLRPGQHTSQLTCRARLMIP
jgi:hypothetical protein